MGNCRIIPNMHPKRFNPDSGSSQQMNRPEYTKRLTSLRETPFGTATSADPWQITDRCGMIRLYSHQIFCTRFCCGCNINGKGSTPSGMLPNFNPVHPDCGVGPHSLKI